MFNFEDILAKAANVEYFTIPVSQEDLVFLVRNEQTKLAATLYELIKPNDGSLKLPKRYDLTIREDMGMRGDRLMSARRLEIVAAIGEELGVSEEQAFKYLADQKKWGSLSEKLQSEITQFFIGFFAEDAGDSSLPARRITTVLQERLTPAWSIDWTLALPRSLVGKLVEYINGEETKWEDEVFEDEVIDVIPETGKNGRKSTAKQLEASETV